MKRSKTFKHKPEGCLLRVGEQADKDSIDFLLDQLVFELCDNEALFLRVDELYEAVFTSNDQVLPVMIPAEQLDSTFTIWGTPGFDGRGGFGWRLCSGLASSDTLLDDWRLCDSDDWVERGETVLVRRKKGGGGGVKRLRMVPLIRPCSSPV